MEPGDPELQSPLTEEEIDYLIDQDLTVDEEIEQQLTLENNNDLFPQSFLDARGRVLRPLNLDLNYCEDSPFASSDSSVEIIDVKRPYSPPGAPQKKKQRVNMNYGSSSEEEEEEAIKHGYSSDDDDKENEGLLPRSLLLVVDVEDLTIHWCFIERMKDRYNYVYFLQPDFGDIDGLFTIDKRKVEVTRTQYAYANKCFPINNNFEKNPSIRIPAAAKEWFVKYGNQMTAVSRRGKRKEATPRGMYCYKPLKPVSQAQLDWLYHDGLGRFSG
jgi:hypothetical protein